MAATIASLLVKIGAQDQDLQKALAAIGQKTRSVDADLKKLGNTPLGTAAKKSLEDFNSTFKAITDAQRKFADQAVNAARGIDAIGGPARLAKTQLDQMGRSVERGIDAFRALGQEAPKDLQRVADAIAKQQKALAGSSVVKPGGGVASGFLSALPGGALLGGGLAGAAAAGGAALALAAKQALDYADSLTKLSDRTGIGTEALQRLESVAEASGNSLDQIGTAVSQFQNRLSSGDKAAAASLQEIGLSIAEIRKLSPDEQFFAIAKSIQSIKDPADQVRIAMDLFGRSGAELLPSLKSDIDKLKDSTLTMSAESIKALDDFGDAMGRWAKSTKAAVGEAFGLLLRAGAKDFFVLSSKNENQSVDLPKVAAANERAAIGTERLGRSQDELIGLLNDGLSAQLQSADAALKHAQALEAVNEKIRLLSAPVQTLTRGQQDLVLSYQALGLSNEEISTKTGIATRAIDAFDRSIESVASHMAASVASTDQARSAIGRLDLGYIKATQSAGLLRKAQLTLTENQARDFAGGPTLDAITKIDNFNRHAVKLGDITDRNSGTMAQFRKETIRSGDDLEQLAESFARLAQVSGGSLGQVVQQMGQLVTAIDLAIEAMDTFADSTASGLERIAAGLSLVGAGIAIGTMAFDAISGLFRDEEHERVNDMRDAYVDAAGGLHQLNVAAHEAGLTLDDLLNADTVEEYTAAIDRLNAAISRQNELERRADRFGPTRTQQQQEIRDAADTYELVKRQFELGERTQEQVQAAYIAYQEAIAAAGGDAGKAAEEWLRLHRQVAGQTSELQKAAERELEGLISQRDALAKGIAAEAPEQTMGVIEQQQRAQLAVLDDEIARKGEEYKKLAQETGTDMAKAIEDALRRIQLDPLHIQVLYDFPAVQGAPVPAAATGGRVVPGGIQHFADGGRVLPFVTNFRPRGTDTVPAMLTPGELVINAAQQGNLANALKQSERVINVTIPVQIDRRTLAELHVENLLQDEAGIRRATKRVANG